MSEVPHSPQNRAWGRFSTPQLGQWCCSGTPQPIQNFTPSGLAKPHLAQCMLPLYSPGPTLASETRGSFVERLWCRGPACCLRPPRRRHHNVATRQQGNPVSRYQEFDMHPKRKTTGCRARKFSLRKQSAGSKPGACIHRHGKGNLADGWLLSHLVAAQHLAGQRARALSVLEGDLTIHDRIAIAVRLLYPSPVVVGQVIDCLHRLHSQLL